MDKTTEETMERTTERTTGETTGETKGPLANAPERMLIPAPTQARWIDLRSLVPEVVPVPAVAAVTVCALWLAFWLMRRGCHAIRIVRAARRMRKRQAEHSARRRGEMRDDEEAVAPLGESLDGLGVKED